MANNPNQHTEIKEIPKIAEYFELPPPAQISPITQSLANHNYLVSTDAEKYIFRFLILQTTKSVENEIEIQRQLQFSGILTPSLVKSPRGYIYGNRGVRAVAMSFIDGVVPNPIPAELALEIGKTHARFHTNVSDLPHQSKSWLHPSNSNIPLPKMINYQSLPLGIIHGDLHAGNIHVLESSPHKVYAIFDFEEAGEDIFIVDIARSLIGICFDKTNILSEKILDSYLKGYNTIRNMTDEEFKVLTDAISYATKACINWFKENNYHKYIPIHEYRAKQLETYLTHQIT